MQYTVQHPDQALEMFYKAFPRRPRPQRTAEESRFTPAKAAAAK
ncbi:hypothetical protein [Pigmentiphaga soli]